MCLIRELSLRIFSHMGNFGCILGEKYLVTPHVTWYNGTTSKYFKFASIKFFETNLGVHKIRVNTPYNFQIQIQNCHKETKKINCYANSVILCFCLFVTLFMLVLYFFYFSICILNLILELLGIVNTRLMNIHKFIKDFVKLVNFIFKECGIMVSCTVWYH
jgi:hypothetical protein